MASQIQWVVKCIENQATEHPREVACPADRWVRIRPKPGCSTALFTNASGGDFLIHPLTNSVASGALDPPVVEALFA
jgi:hypothetical protein